ncbi:MAG: hypothetical protein IH851_07110 [Armatimonadetes bacterium]|nr:hypothetical protein [Armatimonadota bacterium]
MRSAAAVELDGAHGEGGGSIVRTALAMSALTGQPVAIRNVRGGLRKPGVGPIDLAIAEALSLATRAETSARLGDDLLLFAPRKPLAPVRHRIDLNAIAKGVQPGSAVLILLSLLVPLARSGGIGLISCRGGTHVPFAPTYDYFRFVTLPALARAGVVALPAIQSAGYSHRGGGEVSLEIEPSGLNGFEFEERGAMLSVRAAVVISELPEATGIRGSSRLEQLAKKNDLDMKVEMHKLRSPGPGAAVTIGAEFAGALGGAQALGQRGKPMEEVVDEAFYDFIHWLNGDAGTDQFLADHLVLPAALCDEPCAYTTSRITLTLTTTVWVIKQFMPAKITVYGEEGEPGEVRFG